MRLHFSLAPEREELHSAAGVQLEPCDISDYFKRLLALTPPLQSVREVVDLRRVLNFGAAYGQMDEIVRLYGELLSRGAIRETAFWVQTPRQEQMAQVYQALAQRAGGQAEVIHRPLPAEPAATLLASGAQV